MKPLTAIQKYHPRTTDVWLTPPEIISDLGPFDLDPCAAPNPRPWPTATVHYTKEQDGLSLPWTGAFVWLNPEYSNANAWIKKLAEHGNGIALLFARTETNSYFEDIFPKASCLFFVRGRIRFCKPDGTRMRKGVGASVLVGYGGDALKRLSRTRIPGVLFNMWRTV